MNRHAPPLAPQLAGLLVAAAGLLLSACNSGSARSHGDAAPDANVTVDGAPTDAAPPGVPDPAVFRTPDDNAVCSPTPAVPCSLTTMDWVASEYGTTITRAPADKVTAAGVVYRLVAMVERVGPANIDVVVVDQDGAVMPGVPVAFYYPGVPGEARPDEWYPSRIVTTTGDDGRAGFAIGSGAYLPSCGAGGPHAIWVSQPGAAPDTTVPNDLVDHLGMLGGTNHRHLDLLFQRVVVGSTPAAVTACPLP